MLEKTKGEYKIENDHLETPQLKEISECLPMIHRKVHQALIPSCCVLSESDSQPKSKSSIILSNS